MVQKVMVVDVWRGQLRARKWPRERGMPKQSYQRESLTWLTEMVREYKMSASGVIEQSRQAGALLRVRPQDRWLHVTSGCAWLIITPDGEKVFPMRFLALMSHIFDNLAFAPGALMVRWNDGWRPLPAGSVGSTLKMGKIFPEWSDGTTMTTNQPTNENVARISDEIDAFSQKPGTILYRGLEYWTALPPGKPGDVLKIGADGWPEWGTA